MKICRTHAVHPYEDPHSWAMSYRLAAGLAVRCPKCRAKTLTDEHGQCVACRKVKKLRTLEKAIIKARFPSPDKISPLLIPGQRLKLLRPNLARCEFCGKERSSKTLKDCRKLATKQGIDLNAPFVRRFRVVEVVACSPRCKRRLENAVDEWKRRNKKRFQEQRNKRRSVNALGWREQLVSFDELALSLLEKD